MGYDGGEEAFCLQWFCRQVVGSLLVKDGMWDKLLLDEAKLSVRARPSLAGTAQLVALRPGWLLLAGTW